MLKQALNAFLEVTFKHRDSPFEEMSVSDLRKIHEASMQLVREASDIISRQ